MKISSIIIAAAVLLLYSSFNPVYVFSQNEIVSADTQVHSVPDGWKNIRLGMSFQDVQSQLVRDMAFGYRGERDVSLLPNSRTLIETPGYSFFTRCWFQFYQEKLYTLIFTLNSSEVDYFSMFNTLSQKYGPPSFFSPQRAEWADESTLMSLEKPLTIKYIDKKVFGELQDKSIIKQSADEMVRSDFLESF